MYFIFIKLDNRSVSRRNFIPIAYEVETINSSFTKCKIISLRTTEYH
ncbi:hypothetical protein GCM10022393_26450 [Aquimarina addita]|uniref:Uncharacterized protein n=1 Tax=Aquimarina addita TaxID=870485 RepID=A0ABP6UNQ2_9FLAO